MKLNPILSRTQYLIACYTTGNEQVVYADSTKIHQQITHGYSMERRLDLSFQPILFNTAMRNLARRGRD